MEGMEMRCQKECTWETHFLTFFDTKWWTNSWEPVSDSKTLLPLLVMDIPVLPKILVTDSIKLSLTTKWVFVAFGKWPYLGHEWPRISNRWKGQTVFLLQRHHQRTMLAQFHYSGSPCALPSLDDITWPPMKRSIPSQWVLIRNLATEGKMWSIFQRVTWWFIELNAFVGSSVVLSYMEHI